MRMDEVEKLIEIYKRLEDAGLMVVAGKKDTAELMVSQDVVPVVRCKDCKHYCPYNRECDHPKMWTSEYAYLEEISEDSFCSYGERR